MKKKLIALFALCFISNINADEIIYFEDSFYSDNLLKSGQLGINISKAEFIPVGDVRQSFKVCSKSQKLFCLISDVFSFAIPTKNITLKDVWSFDGVQYEFIETIKYISLGEIFDVNVIRQKHNDKIILVFVKNRYEIIGYTDNLEYKKNNKRLFMVANNKSLNLEKIDTLVSNKKDSILNNEQYELLENNELIEYDSLTRIKRVKCLYDFDCD